MTDIKYFQLITGCPDEVDFPIKKVSAKLSRAMNSSTVLKN